LEIAPDTIPAPSYSIFHADRSILLVPYSNLGDIIQHDQTGQGALHQHSYYMTQSPDDICGINLSVYRLLYQIEVGLREFIIKTLTTKCGPRWWKERLPPDVLEAYRKGRVYERSIKWCYLVPHHPLYYIDFPDLKKVIERADNWRDVFQPVFKQKDILITTLSQLETIRNTIAHNRRASERNLSITKDALDTLISAIGEEQYRELIATCSSTVDIPKVITLLKDEAISAFETCRACAPLERLEIWGRVNAIWWFDTDYLGHDVTHINRYFNILLGYQGQPRRRGSGHIIEAWLQSQGLETAYHEAMQEFSTIFEEGR